MRLRGTYYKEWQNLYDMSMYFRNRDQSRPVHYENVCHDRRWEGTTDFESRMYATPAQAEEYLKNNISILRQRFDEEDIPYSQLSYSQHEQQERQQRRENNKEDKHE